MSPILLATNNLHKVEEIRAILRDEPLEFQDLSAYPGIPEPEEPDPTYAGNALIKARYYCQHTGQVTLADDSGLEVEALDGRPGVLSARYGGKGTSQSEKIRLLLEEMHGQERRRAQFVCVAALVYPDGRELTETGICVGSLTTEPAGSGGFGYDPIFWLEERQLTMAELPTDEKNRISHRALAFRAIARRLVSQA